MVKYFESINVARVTFNTLYKVSFSVYDDHAFLTRVVNPFLVKLANRYCDRRLRSYVMERVITGGLMDIERRLTRLEPEEACVEELFWLRDELVRGRLDWNDMLSGVERWYAHFRATSPLHDELALLVWKIRAFLAGTIPVLPDHTVKVVLLSRGRPVKREKVLLTYTAPPIEEQAIEVEQRTDERGLAAFTVPHKSTVRIRAMGTESEIPRVEDDSTLKMESNSILRHLILSLRGRV